MEIAFGCIIAYIVLTNVIGLSVGRKVKTSPEFLVANGNFGWIFLVAILCGAWEGSGASIGITQSAFDKGIYPGFYTGFFTLGLVIAGFLVVPLVRRMQILTLPELVGKLFGSSGRWVTAVLWLCQDLVVLAAQFLGAAGIFSALFGLPIHWGILLTLLGVAFYMILGGMVAAAWTNMLHTVVMFTAAIVAVPLAMNYGAGFEGVVAKLPQEYFNVSGLGIPTLLGWFLAVSSGPIIHQMTFSAAASAKSDAECRKGFLISATIIALFSIPFAIMGVVAKTYLPEGTTGLLALPMLAMSISPWFAGLLLSGVMAAVLSTLAPMLFSAPTIFINDIYKPLRPKPSEKELLLVSRISAVAVLAIGVGLALMVKSIVAATTFAFTFRLVLLFCVMIPLIVASRQWITAEGGIFGIFCGALAPTISQLVLKSSIPGMYWAVLGVLFGLVVGSLATRNKGHFVKEVWTFMKPNNNLSK